MNLLLMLIMNFYKFWITLKSYASVVAKTYNGNLKTKIFYKNKLLKDWISVVESVYTFGILYTCNLEDSLQSYCTKTQCGRVY